MTPIKFPEANIVIGKNQKEYESLPAWVDKTPIPDDAIVGFNRGDVVSCWQLSPEEIEKVRETGCIWVNMLTFGLPVHPLFLTVDKNEVIVNEDE